MEKKLTVTTLAYNLDTEKILIRIGIIASKKLGNAVKRNYAKRRIRALFNKVL